MSTKLLAGRYELIEKIGEGGMAIVYKGKDRLLNRYVAIKILRPEYTEDETFIENFIRESQSAAGLTHPNIVGVYDVGKEGNIHFIVMELITGKSLSELIREKGRLDYNEAISIAVQVAKALSLAHKNQIVHRDVKPHNVLITEQGIAKLTDFGIAKAVSASTIVGGSDKVMGSVHYFSPEQARGAYVDERSDIYSLGIVLYEMLTGSVPFDGDNPVSIALMHINNQMPCVNDMVNGLPPQLDKIIRKATEKYQSKRYRNVDEMIEDLESIEFISKIMGSGMYTGQSHSADKPFEDSERHNFSEYQNLDRENSQDNRNKKYEGGSGSNRQERGDFSDRNPSKNEKTSSVSKGTLGIIIGACAALIVIAVLGIGLINGWFSKTQEVPVPDFVGLLYEDAEALATEKGLVLERGEDVFSPEQEAGYVTSQSPSKDSKVKTGKIITVYVSKGKKDGVVPKVEGCSLDEAKSILESYGFVVENTIEVTSSEPKGIVVSQSLKAGATAQGGASITLEISDGKGKPMTQVPNLIGRTPDEAKALIENSGFKVGEVTFEERDDEMQNVVFYQSADPFSSLEEGSEISIKVSKGEQPEGSGNGTDIDGSETEGEGSGEGSDPYENMPSDDEE